MRFIGRVVFYLAWPFWLVYFRVSNNRTRVVIIYENQVLLVKSWLGSGKWGLPGGGVKLREDIKQGAIREVNEETGVDISGYSLQELGTYEARARGFSYTLHMFLVQVPKRYKLKKQRLEISDATWCDLDKLADLKLDYDVTEAVTRYLNTKPSGF